MNLVIKPLVIIVGIFISHVQTTSHHCCPNGVILTSRKCKDGGNVSIACEDHPILLDPSRSAFYEFSIVNDSNEDGKSYLDAYNSGFLIYQPYFCTGVRQKPDGSGPSSNEVAIACSSFREWYRDVSVDGSADVQTAKRFRILAIVGEIFNAISAILLLTTAAIYYALPNVLDLQGTCYFYFSLSVGLGHSLFFYKMIFETDGLLPDMCISNTYIFMYMMLCSVCWSSVSCFNIWRTTMNFKTENEEELVKRYKIFGFGLPLLLIFLAWVHVHLKNIADLTFVFDCVEHQIVVYGIYISMPVLLLLFANFLMFIHSQIRIWNLHTITLQDKKLTMKILKYRLFMNAKLFFVMGVPWAFLMIMFIAEDYIDFGSTFVKIIQFVTAMLILLEGLPIFVILVVFRKRVLRGIARKWFVNTKIFPDKWKTMRDSETEEELSDDETPSRRSPEAKYTANINDDDKSTFDDTVVVNL